MKFLRTTAALSLFFLLYCDAARDGKPHSAQLRPARIESLQTLKRTETAAPAPNGERLRSPRSTKKAKPPFRLGTSDSLKLLLMKQYLSER